VVTEIDPEEHAGRLAADAIAAGNPAAWFERLYAQASRGEAIVPWDRDEPHQVIVDWFRGVYGDGRRALVVGAGLGRDAEFVARLGFVTTAFDMSPSAVDTARRRHAGSPVRYVQADLLDPPAGWRHAFDLVLESLTVQSLPIAMHGSAIAAVPQFVASGGTLLVVAAGRDDDVPAGDGPPWPLLRSEIDAFASDGVQPVRVDAIADPAAPAGLRWRAEFRRP
jgi:SAM-dependent methyltransferase